MGGWGVGEKLVLGFLGGVGCYGKWDLVLEGGWLIWEMGFGFECETDIENEN